MNAINELSTFVSWKVRIVSKLENKTFRISTANPAVITDSILRDIQIRQCPLVASQSKIFSQYFQQSWPIYNWNQSRHFQLLIFLPYYLFLLLIVIFSYSKGGWGCSYILSELQSSISIINVNNVTVVSSHRTQNTTQSQLD